VISSRTEAVIFRKERKLMKTSSSARKLAEVIHAAIADHIITTAEYEEILHIANEDGSIDPEERALLAQLQEMIADKTVRRVAG
jgi:tellurite resistance protein